MEIEKVFSGVEFDWDKWNADKIREKHKVQFPEAEEVFFDINLIILPDPTHSIAEERYIALGKTKTSSPLFVVFTERSFDATKKIRIISARDMSKKERRRYHEQTKKSAGA
ncbi:MAG: BrnT family toxin [Candidatus Omnitrophota bacterium]